MTRGFSWRTAAKIAWRETRSSSAKFAFVVMAVAAGVGSLTGVRGFSESFHGMLLRDARTLMAADLSVRLFALPNPDQEKTLQSIDARGIGRTQITETLSMAASANTRDPLLVSVKAVDPSRYPYYGAVKLRPEGRLQDVLNAGTCAVSDDLLLRLHINVGDDVRIGGQNFRVAAVVISEPDRMSGSLNLGLRLMLTRQGLERTGLIRFGSRAAQRFLFKLPMQGTNLTNVEAVRQELKKAFPEALVTDFRETHPIISRGLERSTMFLSLVSLIALIVGALGVGMAMHAHLQQKLDNIAVMKSLGGRSNQILRIYLVQTLLLGLAGGLLGVMVGGLIQLVFPILIARYFSLHPAPAWSFLTAGQGILVGLLTTLLFTLPPLLDVRRVKPSLILRRNMPEAQRTWKQRLADARLSIVAGIAIIAGMGAIAAWLADSLRLGGYFVGGLVASLAALFFVAWILLRTIRAFLKRSPFRLPVYLRHGMANLYRQGNQAQTVLVALGVGVMFTLTVYLVQHDLLAQIRETAPPGMPNVFLIDITQAQRDAVFDLLTRQPGVEGTPEIIPSVAAKLISVDGTPVDKLNLQGFGRRFLATRSVMWDRQMPPNTKILQGAWWPKNTQTPVVSVAEEAAKILNLKPGSQIEMVAQGRAIKAEVRAVHRTEAIRVSSNNEFIFNPPPLAGLPVIFYGGLRVKASQVPALQRIAYERFPTVTVINVADALEIVQEVVDQIALVIRFLSLFAILGGAIILASSVAGTRLRRMREVVILKTLGGTQTIIARIFSVEFLALGLVAGAMGSLLATTFSGILLKRVMDAQFHFEILPNLVCIVLTAFLANASGWLASFRILGQKPLEILREE